MKFVKIVLPLFLVMATVISSKLGSANRDDLLSSLLKEIETNGIDKSVKEISVTSTFTADR